VSEKKPAPAEARIEAPDPYQEKYMAGPDGLLHYDKIKAPKWWSAILLIPLANLIAMFALPVPWFMLLGPVIILPIVWMLFSVLRVTVTRKELIIQYGLFGPRIPIDAIESAEATTYKWSTYGGWGIRRGWDGTICYNMAGDGGRAVKIVYEENGKKKTILVATQNTEALARAIAEARAKRFETPKLRVAEVTSDPVAEAEAEAEAILAEREERARAK
jgi:hypothetical protein